MAKFLAKGAKMTKLTKNLTFIMSVMLASSITSATASSNQQVKLIASNSEQIHLELQQNDGQITNADIHIFNYQQTDNLLVQPVLTTIGFSSQQSLSNEQSVITKPTPNKLFEYALIFTDKLQWLIAKWQLFWQQTQHKKELQSAEIKSQCKQTS